MTEFIVYLGIFCEKVAILFKILISVRFSKSKRSSIQLELISSGCLVAMKWQRWIHFENKQNYARKKSISRFQAFWRFFVDFVNLVNFFQRTRQLRVIAIAGCSERHCQHELVEARTVDPQKQEPCCPPGRLHLCTLCWFRIWSCVLKIHSNK